MCVAAESATYMQAYPNTRLLNVYQHVEVYKFTHSRDSVHAFECSTGDHLTNPDYLLEAISVEQTMVLVEQPVLQLSCLLQVRIIII